MSIQRIIDQAQRLGFDRRKIVGQTLSRSQRIKSAERVSVQPFIISVTPPGSLTYSSNRDLLETITLYDRTTEYTIKLANNTKLSYLTQYRGALSTANLAALTVTNYTTSSFIVGNLPTANTATVIFAAGDFIQPVNSRYPYTVAQNVLRGLDDTVVVPTHRPIITSEATTLTGALLIGTDTTIRMIVSQLPSYEIVPRDRVQFNGDFELIEKII